MKLPRIFSTWGLSLQFPIMKYSPKLQELVFIDEVEKSSLVYFHSSGCFRISNRSTVSILEIQCNYILKYFYLKSGF